MLAFCTCVLRVPAQTNFATLTTDGAWTWYNDPRALFHNDKLYFGFVRADGKSALAVFTPTNGVTTNLWVSGFTQVDDHNNPGLLAKQDGKLLAVYSRHISDQYFAYRRSNSTNPILPGDWAAEQIIPNSGAGMTYANPFQLSAESGKIYNFCRNQNFNPTIYTSTDGGSNWSSPELFIQAGTGGTVRPYLKYCSDYTNRIDFLYTDGHPRDIANSLYHLYYQGGAFYQTDGTLVKGYGDLPILHDSGERGSVIYQYSDAAQSDPNQWIPTGRAWCWETAYQTNGSPVCVFTVQRDNIAPSGSLTDRIYYYYARWTGTEWQKRFVAQAGRPLYNAEDDYAGGICVDPQNPNVIYISSNAQNPFNLTDTTNVTLRASERYELWRGVTSDGGLNFAWTQITTNSAQDNLRPYIPRRNGGEPCVIWFRGAYSSYTAYACSIVGLFTTPIPIPPTPPPPPPITYVDATSGAGGNTTLAGGSTFSPPLNGTTGMDNNWEQRTVLGSGGNIFESSGEAAENAPELRTTITGLTPGANYSIHVFFWDASGTTENWNIRAGFASAPDTNPLYSAADATTLLSANPAGVASSLYYVTAPTVFNEANRVLLAAEVGTNLVDVSGSIRVFIDDKPSTIGANNRTWYDGLGYALLVSTPTNVNIAERIYAITTDNKLIAFDSTAPGTILSSYALSGLQANENIIGIDFWNGTLYGLGSQSRLYTINRANGAAGLVGSFSPVLNGQAFGFDAEPAGLRVVSELDQNLLLNYATGAATAGTTLNGSPNPSVTGLAYHPGSGQRFVADYFQNTIGLMNPGSGLVGAIGPAGIDFSRHNGFDISANPGNTAYLASPASSSGTAANLYKVDFTTGLASLVGLIGLAGDDTLIRGLAVGPGYINLDRINLSFTASGNQLNLSWPADHIGWHLQTQTNSLAAGLGTNWFTVPGSVATNMMVIPMSSAGSASVFYRLVYP